MTRELPLSNGGVALVDENDWSAVSSLSWHRVDRPDGQGAYASANIRTAAGRRRVFLHRFITGAPAAIPVDHRDGDGLNNTRANLRVCSTQQNARNRRRHSNSTTGFKGVARQNKAAGFRAYIMIDGHQITLGSFRTPQVAARAYDRAAVEHFGEFARLNFPTHRDWLFPHEHVGPWPPPA